jgi:hypothetical protein
LKGIRGSVTIVGAGAGAGEMSGGDSYNRGQHTMFGAPRTLACTNVDGDFTVRFVRSDLKLKGIGGRIDVRNDFGDTLLEAVKALAADRAHRIVSESGKVDVRLAKGMPISTPPLIALTNCGTIRTNIDQDVLESTSFTVSRDAGEDDGGTVVARSWRGLKPPAAGGKRNPESMFALFNRPPAVLRGADRPPGLDLVSRAGVAKVVAER